MEFCIVFLTILVSMRALRYFEVIIHDSKNKVAGPVPVGLDIGG